MDQEAGLRLTAVATAELSLGIVEAMLGAMLADGFVRALEMSEVHPLLTSEPSLAALPKDAVWRVLDKGLANGDLDALAARAAARVLGIPQPCRIAARKLTLHSACRIAFSDSGISEREQNYLRNLAKLLGLPRGRVAATLDYLLEPKSETHSGLDPSPPPAHVADLATECAWLIASSPNGVCRFDGHMIERVKRAWPSAAHLPESRLRRTLDQAARIGSVIGLQKRMRGLFVLLGPGDHEAVRVVLLMKRVAEADGGLRPEESRTIRLAPRSVFHDEASADKHPELLTAP